MQRTSSVWIWLALGAAFGGHAVGCHRAGESNASAEPGTGGEQAPVACGAGMCAAGQICCNPSCGICTPPDGMCTQQFCDSQQADGGLSEGPVESNVTCDNVRCAAGTHCELNEVQCIRAPCPPVPECKPDATPGK